VSSFCSIKSCILNHSISKCLLRFVTPSLIIAIEAELSRDGSGSKLFDTHQLLIHTIFSLPIIVRAFVRIRVTLVYVIYHTRTQGLYKECTTLHMGVSVAPNNLNHTTVSSVTYLHTMYDTWFIYTHLSVFLFVFMDRPWFMPVACVACTPEILLTRIIPGSY